MHSDLLWITEAEYDDRSVWMIRAVKVCTFVMIYGMEHPEFGMQFFWPGKVKESADVWFSNIEWLFRTKATIDTVWMPFFDAFPELKNPSFAKMFAELMGAVIELRACRTTQLWMIERMEKTIFKKILKRMKHSKSSDKLPMLMVVDKNSTLYAESIIYTAFLGLVNRMKYRCDVFSDTENVGVFRIAIFRKLARMIPVRGVRLVFRFGREMLEIPSIRMLDGMTTGFHLEFDEISVRTLTEVVRQYADDFDSERICQMLQREFPKKAEREMMYQVLPDFCSLEVMEAKMLVRLLLPDVVEEFKKLGRAIPEKLANAAREVSEWRFIHFPLPIPIEMPQFALQEE